MVRTTSLLLLACGGGSATTGDAGAVADARPDAGPPPICRAGSHWTAGTPAFREATTDWGLDAIGAQGTRLSVTDIDGDGWADLIIRNTGAPDDFSDGGMRTTWLLRNTGAGGFEDVTRQSGLRATRYGSDPNVGRPGEVAVSADVDNDGDLDVFTGHDRGDPNGRDEETSELMLNDGAGHFTLGPRRSDARNELAPSMPAGLAFTDVDRDGFVDLWMTHNMPAGSPQALQDRLYRGDGRGVFTDVTDASGLTTGDWTLANLNAGIAHSWAWSAAACDLNGDGWPELLASSYGRMPNHLWQAQGGGTFVHRGIESGYAFDGNQDWTDNASAQCWCHDHPTDQDCDRVPPPRLDCAQLAMAFGGRYRWDHATGREPYSLGGNSGATLCADVNNDGAIDLVTSEIVHFDVGQSSDPAELLVNAGEADVRFERPGNATTGLARRHLTDAWNEGIMSGAVFDFDADGWPDIYWGDSDYPGTRARLYHQESPGRFVEMETQDFFEHNRAHGVAVADFDHDGDLDVVVGHSHARCGPPNDCYPTQQVRLFENVLGAQSNWIQLRLEGGAGSNRAAIGARVTVAAGGVTQTQEVDGGHGHFGTQRDLVLQFGLGAACEADVTVRWPDAALTTEHHHVAAGYRYRWRQGEAPIVDDQFAGGR